MEFYYIIDEYDGKTDLQVGAVIRTNEFDKTFYYPKKDLGVTLEKEKTMFKVWAPTAVMMKLILLAADESSAEVIAMNRSEKGVWYIEVDRCLEGYHYHYLAQINQVWREAIDPNARAVTANGKAGVIIDLEKAKVPKIAQPELESPCDAIIYETHIRDLTMHPQSGVKRKGTYLGAAELGTQSPAGEPTGLSYIKDLGVTHIEFLPFHDFEGVDETNPSSQYNWGYNPIHFNVPDGSYSSDASHPYKRILELKKMIQVIHSQGLGVIMDVVYNHVYIREQSSFEQLVPGYYFRQGHDGMPSNGTGVGNDFASERLMGRKFILDSIEYWLKEFQIDGLRFDLMGILDIKTMRAVSDLVHEINPSAIIIGEGWDLNTPIAVSEKASIGNQDKLPRVGQFNDWFRDTIKGSTFNLYDRGYALGNERYTDAAKQVLAGSIGIGKRKHGLFNEPIQTVNYVESHDNHTLWDKLVICEQEQLEKKHRLATSMVLLAQGIPFIHSGQEFFRTKKGIGNSYRSSDNVNWLDWERRDLYFDHVNYIKGILSIRKSHKAFRFSRTSFIHKHMTFLPLPPPTIGYILTDVKQYGEWSQIIVCFNPSTEVNTLKLPQDSGWKILADDKQASARPIQTFSGEAVDVEPFSLVIVVH